MAKKNKGIRNVPMQTTKVMDSTFRPPQMEISRPLKDIDVNVLSSSRKSYIVDMFSLGNSDTQNIVSPGST